MVLSISQALQINFNSYSHLLIVCSKFICQKSIDTSNSESVRVYVSFCFCAHNIIIKSWFFHAVDLLLYSRIWEIIEKIYHLFFSDHSYSNLKTTWLNDAFNTKIFNYSSLSLSIYSGSHFYIFEKLFLSSCI